MPDDSENLKRWAGMFGIAAVLGSCGLLAYSAYLPTTPAFLLADPGAVADAEKQDAQRKTSDFSAGICFARPTASDTERKGFAAYEVDCSGYKTNLTVDMRSTFSAKQK